MSCKILNKVINIVKYSSNEVNKLEFYLRTCSLPEMQAQWELINWKKYFLCKRNE